MNLLGDAGSQGLGGPVGNGIRVVVFEYLAKSKTSGWLAAATLFTVVSFFRRVLHWFESAVFNLIYELI